MLTTDNDTLSEIDDAPTVAMLTTPSGQEASSIVIQVSLQVIYCVIGATGVVGNLCTVVVIALTMDTQKTLTNLLILIQSCIDLVCSSFLILTTTIADPHRYIASMADYLYCKIWLTKMPLWVSFMASSCGLIAITIERFVAIKFPIWHKTSMTRTKLLVCTGLLLLFGCSITTTYCSLSTIIANNQCMVYTANPGNIGTIMVTAQFFLPIFVFFVVYTQMASVLRHRVTPANTTAANGQGNSNKQSKLTRNILLTLLKVVACFVVCWSPNQIYYFLFLIGVVKMKFQSVFYHISVILIFCNCCCNPVVYALSYKQFRAGARKLLNRATKGGTANNTSGTHSTTKDTV